MKCEKCGNSEPQIKCSECKGCEYCCFCPSELTEEEIDQLSLNDSIGGC